MFHTDATAAGTGAALTQAYAMGTSGSSPTAAIGGLVRMRDAGRRTAVYGGLIGGTLI